MSAKLEEVALIKADIVKAFREVDKGDNGAAITALAEALSELVAYILREEK